MSRAETIAAIIILLGILLVAAKSHGLRDEMTYRQCDITATEMKC